MAYQAAVPPDSIASLGTAAVGFRGEAIIAQQYILDSTNNPNAGAIAGAAFSLSYNPSDPSASRPIHDSLSFDLYSDASNFPGTLITTGASVVSLDAATATLDADGLGGLVPGPTTPIPVSSTAVLTYVLFNSLITPVYGVPYWVICRSTSGAPLGPPTWVLGGVAGNNHASCPSYRGTGGIGSLLPWHEAFGPSGAFQVYLYQMLYLLGSRPSGRSYAQVIG